MPKYVANRDFILRSTKGFTYKFEKGVPRFIVPQMEPEAIAAGCVPEAEAKPAVKETVEEAVEDDASGSAYT